MKSEPFYVTVIFGSKDNLNAFIHNPSNQHNQPKQNIKVKTAFEIAVLEGLSAFNSKFDSLNRYMIAIERKFQEMDKLVEHLYQRDKQNHNNFKDNNNSLFDNNEQPIFTMSIDFSNSFAIP